MSGQQMDVNEDGDLIPIQDKISNPFGIVSDQYDTEADKLRVDFSNDIRTTLSTASEGERDHSSLVEDFGKATAVQSSPSPPREERVGIKVNLLSDFDAEATEKGETNPSESTNASTCEPARVRPPSLEANSQAEIQGHTQSSRDLWCSCQAFSRNVRTNLHCEHI
jgi:hypothetical protein